jgi:hypothetical protein
VRRLQVRQVVLSRSSAVIRAVETHRVSQAVVGFRLGRSAAGGASSRLRCFLWKAMGWGLNAALGDKSGLHPLAAKSFYVGRARDPVALDCTTMGADGRLSYPSG